MNRLGLLLMIFLLPKRLLAVCFLFLPLSLFSHAQNGDNNRVWAEEGQILFEQGIMALHTDKPSLAYHLLSCSYASMPAAATAYALAELTRGRIADLSTEWAGKAFSISPSEERYMQLYVEGLLQQNERRRSIEVLEQYRTFAPKDIPSALFLTELYLVEQEVQKAKKLFDEVQPMLKDTPHEEVEHTMRFKILQAMGADAQEVRRYAEQLLHGSLKENPGKAVVGLSYLLSMGEAKAVSEILGTLSDAERKLPACSLIAYSAYLAENRDDEARRELMNLLSSKQLSPDEALTTLLPLLQRQTKKGVLLREYNPILEALLALHPDKYELHASYVAQLYGQGDAAGALKYLYQLTQLFPKDHPEIWAALIEERLSDGDFPSAEQFIDEGLKQYPSEASLIVYRGLIRMAEEKYASAEQLFLKALECTSEEESAVRAEIYSHLGDLQYAQMRLQAAFAYYEKALSHDPKQVSVLNNYAYYLATQGGDLEKAARMASQAATLQPDTPHILDTYGYILYLQKNYTLAEIYLRKALDNSTNAMPGRVTYLLHYVDVLEALGRMADAVDLLEREQKTLLREEITKRIEQLKK